MAEIFHNRRRLQLSMSFSVVAVFHDRVVDMVGPELLNQAGFRGSKHVAVTHVEKFPVHQVTVPKEGRAALDVLLGAIAAHSNASAAGWGHAAALLTSPRFGDASPPSLSVVPHPVSAAGSQSLALYRALPAATPSTVPSTPSSLPPACAEKIARQGRSHLIVILHVENRLVV
jgi:hypothetical protein